MDKETKEIFKKGSKTYFNSSLFFPKDVREDVFKLYSFVRTADDFVDSIPQKTDEFYSFKDDFLHSLEKGFSENKIINNYLEVAKKRNFDTQWAIAFLKSMEMDLTKKTYDSLQETLEYIYGSAEVIGFFMAKILNLPDESLYYAGMLGRSMQYINFIRDIDEDNKLGRRYLPLNNNLTNLLYNETSKKREEFISFIRNEIEIYYKWVSEAEKGFMFIPKRMLVPIKTASDMYKWTANKIYKDPFVVYKKKVKPSKIRIIFKIIENFLR
ncbi:MAG: phytoene/squalene synthase family protein [Brevinematales bacterium]|nr:phytoene/squalene synthase family protein [Brevinematales bacterium]